MTDTSAELHWLREFSATAEVTDRLRGGSDHIALLATGMMGEAGSILTELKKEQRERNAYPAYRGRMLEEFGDFLWYFTRMVSIVDRELLGALTTVDEKQVGWGAGQSLPLFLRFGAAVGNVLAEVERGIRLREQLVEVWRLLLLVAKEANVDLREATKYNYKKTQSRWPQGRDYAALFDTDFPEEEQLPRLLEVEFREQARGNRRAVILRCNGLNFGDRLTDNIEDPDGYRYHDIFHFSHAVHLGWSPVVRALLKCKRKSSVQADEGQDGARAIIVEEAISAITFSRAKQLGFFDRIDQVDYDLLKSIQEFVRGFEVDKIPLWQWEVAILEGYSVFRLLQMNRGGKVTLDILKHELRYVAPAVR